MAVQVDPPGFAPLMEWRLDGHAREIGASTTTWFTDTGNHVAEVGPLLNPAQIEIETYSVTITSHTSGEDIVEEGEPIVFIAETDPPGYENEITWLSSTLYGTAEPIFGEGPIFIAEFNDTWGIDENGAPFQWLGVKADNAAFNQDQKVKCCVFDAAALDAYCQVVNNTRKGEDVPPPPEQCVDASTCIECEDALGGICYPRDCPLFLQTIRVVNEDAPAGGERHSTWTALVCDPPPQVPGCMCDSLVDALFTPPDGLTFVQFGSPDIPPIPADFFFPGSDPFVGQVGLRGEPLGNSPFGVYGTADTLILRSSDPFDCNDPLGGPVTVDIEIVALSLRSIDPITVGGPGPPLWDVAVDLSVVPQQPGQLNAVKTHANGGFFDSVLPVLPRFTFTEVGNPGNIRVLDAGLVGLPPLLLQSPGPIPWVHEVKLGTLKPEGNPSCFNPGIVECVEESAAAGNCNDGFDNDCDGDTDCDDSDCDGDPECP